MWFRKKAVKTECVGCGCLMGEVRKRVEVEEWGVKIPLANGGQSFLAFASPHFRTERYCGRCAPSYDERRDDGVASRYFRKEPAQNIEVTEEGKPIKDQPAH